jgi:hypothetical protein
LLSIVDQTVVRSAASKAEDMDVQRSYVLQSLLLDFVKRFVQESINTWYNELTIDASFGDKVVHVLMKSIDELQRRLQSIEWANFVCIDMVRVNTGLILFTNDDSLALMQVRIFTHQLASYKLHEITYFPSHPCLR